MSDNTATKIPVFDWKWQLSMLLTPRALVHIVFWSWHVMWLFAVFVGVGPHLLPQLVIATFAGDIPWGITACALGLGGFPILTLLAGMRVRDDHRRLFGLFYGVAGVGMTLLIVRLFFIRELTPEVAFVWTTLAIGAAFFAADLFGRVSANESGLAQVGSLVGYTALLVIGVWIGVAMGMYCVPAIVIVVREFPGLVVDFFAHGFDHGWMWRLPIFGAIAAIMACIAFVVLSMPFAIVVMYTRAWWRGLVAWRTSHGLASGLAITGAVIAAWICGFVLLSQQPQHEAFARLEQAPVDRAAQADNLAHEDEIRAGLLNAYLAPYRYWGGVGNNVQLARMYEDAFATDGDVLGAQHLFNAVASPLLYQGAAVRADQQRAAVAYEQFFDRPLQDGDRDAVLAAISATYDRSEAEAGLLDVGNRNVLLAAQELTSTISGDVAHFELHETYANQTNERQEVFYYFELPERAVITGLWLSAGSLPRRDFAYTVAPRGAAQQVYKQQRQRNIDPALVEQVSPQQYRLRIFPIPADGRGDLEPIMHLWMEWSVLGDGAGWKLPRLVEARNVYWDEDDTQRTIDGTQVEHARWLPARIDADVQRRSHELVVGDTLVRATPTDVGTPAPRRGETLAVVVDTSRSMGTQAALVHATLQELAARGYAFDLFTSPSPYSADVPQRVALGGFDPAWYGGHTHEGLLADFSAVRGDASYAAVVVITDPGSFAFQSDPAPVHLETVRRDAPIWMLHLGGLPYAYRDPLADLVRASGGGAATDLETVLERMHAPVIEGFTWTFEAASTTGEADTTDPFAPLAAAALVMHLGGRGTDLDTVHAIAKTYAVVSPWSSMIVLVDERQHEALAKASEAKDRFDREAESGVEQTSSPDAALEVNGTPEPHEWMLLAIAAFGLLGIARARGGGSGLVGA